jgi:hypothetical protein
MLVAPNLSASPAYNGTSTTSGTTAASGTSTPQNQAMSTRIRDPGFVTIFIAMMASVFVL